MNIYVFKNGEPSVTESGFWRAFGGAISLTQFVAITHATEDRFPGIELKPMYDEDARIIAKEKGIKGIFLGLEYGSSVAEVFE